MKITTAANSEVELAREGDTRLLGSFVLAKGGPIGWR